MKNAVIIGAGQTGRGFVAPILKEEGYSITFLDNNQHLIEELKQEKKYQIRYFGNERDSEFIDNFNAYPIDSEIAVKSIIESDLVITSVFAGHIIELIPYLKTAALKREKPLVIICCENGINVKKPLIDSKINAVISEGVIFCTTLKPYKDSLDLISEYIDCIPIDGSVKGLNLNISRMPLNNNFTSLIQRKIYTYNFISAVIAYLGWYKKYEIYSEAANDFEIMRVIENVKPIISSGIAKEFNISFDEQLKFTQRAINKFKNKEIFDTIYRNARQAKRKLGENERLLSPLRLAQKYNERTIYFDLIIAIAIDYAIIEEEENIDFLWDSILVKQDMEAIKKVFELIKLNKTITDILGELC